MDSTDRTGEPGPVVRAAARGELPAWAEAGEERRAHMARVAELLEAWATDLGLPERERIRWAAAGWLHDVLREAEPARLREMVPAELNDLADGLLHGPAAAERLRDDADPALLNAIRYHTLGHRDLDRLGRALYLADFLEPAREQDPEWRAELRAMMPARMEEVLREVVANRMQHVMGRGHALRPETTEFWASLLGRGA